MCEITLIKPTVEYGKDIMEYRQEFLDAGDSLAGCGSLRTCSSAEEWIYELNMLENKETCPKDKVCSNTYLAIKLSDNKIVGIIDFRHHIDHPILSVWGGHIGFSVRPSERRKGYGKEMLSLALKKCRERNIMKVLITCDKDNIESAKTIISNGGILENEVIRGEKVLQRYWIRSY